MTNSSIRTGFGFKFKPANGFFNIIVQACSLVALLLLSLLSNSFAAPTVSKSAGANPAAIQTTVDQFRASLGQLNPNNGQSFQNGRREINWDGVPDSASSPNFFPHDFFNRVSPRGAVFTTPSANDSTASFFVSADSDNPTSTPVRFGELDPSYTNTFQVFSPQRLFTARNSNITEVQFFIPGTKIPATVSGFGAILCDVDTSASFVKFYDIEGKVLRVEAFDSFNNGLSFVGVRFPDGERVARVQIITGKSSLAAGIIDGQNGNDVVAMDDFIYGEPRSLVNRESDYDGDGKPDFTVFRPSQGVWFRLFSTGGGSGFDAFQFGQSGDVPVEGDFDGDSLSDAAVFRPSNGTWFILNSKDGSTQTVPFGLQGDKPVPADYDGDLKTDIAVWRPSNGTWFVIRSKDSTIQILQFGANGDLPSASSLIP